MKVNITFETDKGNVTFYTIDAVGPNMDDKTNKTYDSIIYSNGIEYKCKKTLTELWSKLDSIRKENENNKR